MPEVNIPSINQAICSSWTELDRNLYNTLPYYLAKLQVDHRKSWQVWGKLVGKMKWEANMGPIMKGVRKDASPHLRQMFFPNEISATPKKDVIGVREVTVTANVRKHRFESPVFNFVPSFRDFLTDHVDYTAGDINDKIVRANDVFIRSHIFHQSPYVFLPDAAGGSLISAPMGDGDDNGATGKTTNWLQATLPTIGNPGNLSLCSINSLKTIAENDLRIPAFGGSGSPQDNAGIQDMHCLVLSSEAWNQFFTDPWLKENKPLDLNVVTEKFQGKLFGNVTCKIEDRPIRFKMDGSLAQPEIIEANPQAYNYGETVPNPAYFDPAQSPIEVAFYVGAEGYKAIDVGPPPKDFASNGMPKGFGKMFWNGELEITKNILVPCLDANSNTILDTNKYGEYLQIISQVTMGIIGAQKRNVIPILFKRKRGC